MFCIVYSNASHSFMLFTNSGPITPPDYPLDSLILRAGSSPNGAGSHSIGENSSIVVSLYYIAKEDTEIAVIDYKKLMNSKNLNHAYFNIFFKNLFDIINTKIKEKNERINILEKKQIREKLLEYFDIEYKKYHSRIIHLPFSLKDFADYMAVNRSAMFRELKNLKEEKFIDIKNRKITLLYKN